MKDRLSPADNELYRATYCGLCRTMRKRCGWLAPTVLNFDFVLLAMLLSAGDESVQTGCYRCHLPPFGKRCMCSGSTALDIAADESVILAYWQMKDRILDSGFFKGLPVRVFCALFSPCYRRARRARTDFDRAVQQQLSALHLLEQAKCPSVDRAADTFANLLCAAAPVTGRSDRDRIMAQLLYQLGRWIYLIDARDDLTRDEKTRSYNPIALRYTPEERDGCLSVTLEHSINLVCSAAELLNLGEYGPLIHNVLHQGLISVQHAVLTDQWAKIKKQKTWRFKHD